MATATPEKFLFVNDYFICRVKEHNFIGQEFYFPTRCDYCQNKVRGSFTPVVVLNFLLTINLPNVIKKVW